MNRVNVARKQKKFFTKIMKLKNTQFWSCERQPNSLFAIIFKGAMKPDVCLEQMIGYKVFLFSAKSKKVILESELWLCFNEKKCVLRFLT